MAVFCFPNVLLTRYGHKFHCYQQFKVFSETSSWPVLRRIYYCW